MAVDLDVCVPVTNRISRKPMDFANPAILGGITNLATTAAQEETANLVGLNGQPLLPKEDLPLAPHTEGMANMEQQLSATTRASPQYYARETRPRINEPAIG
uniref:Uncharacterized protein n=1 Tax=Cannabis sativa TaxID=3483 RepID=A0A803PYC1_CANSA